MARKTAVTNVLPEPPLGKRTKALHVAIDEQLNLRLKMTLLILEAEGSKESKKEFIANAVKNALDEFDNKRSRGRK